MTINHIYHKPCADLDELPDESVQTVVTSPPYNISYKRQRSKKFNLDGYGAFDDHLPEPEYQDQQVRLLEALGRVLRGDGSVFYVHKDRRINGRTISPIAWIDRVRNLSLFQTIIWDRGSSHNLIQSQMPPVTETVYWLSKSGHRPRFNKQCRKWGSVWRICPHAETARIAHPAPFPLAIPLRSLLMSAPRKDDLVLDPYMGSGTTAVAATMLGLPFIGYEINESYIKLSVERIAAVKRDYTASNTEAVAVPGHQKVQKCKGEER